MRLPALLDAWTPWLTPFPLDQATLLGDLLLRLDPMVDPLRRQAGPGAAEPAGIGDIVRRGSYERLLLSEWALADAVPDEFVRRAANGELLFTGPEPAHGEQSLRSVALFDAGPSQLGAARLAQVALFVLLARRAALAGAQFRWGVLQQPGILHDATDERGLRALLDARTLRPADDEAATLWDAALAPDAEDAADNAHGRASLDCWLVGDPASPAPVAANAQVRLRQPWSGTGLAVTVVQQRRSRDLTLPLPPAADCVRLLRHPFEPAGRAAPAIASRAHSLKRPPLFGNERGWLAVGSPDDSVTLYQVPDAPHGKPGRPRNAGRPRHADAIVAAGVVGKSFGALALVEGKLYPFGFPGKMFQKHGRHALPLPPGDAFDAVPGRLRRAQAFFQHDRSKGTVERLIVLDRAGRLVAWTRKGGAADSAFQTISRGVVGAIQHGGRVLFAVAASERTKIYALDSNGATQHLYPLMFAGLTCLFGKPQAWANGGGLYALQRAASTWRVGDRHGGHDVDVDKDDVVLGCAERRAGEPPCLVLLDRTRTRFVLQGSDERTALFVAPEPVAQAAFDPLTDRLAWLGKTSGMLTVRGIADERPLLQTAPVGGPA